MGRSKSVTWKENLIDRRVYGRFQRQKPKTEMMMAPTNFWSTSDHWHRNILFNWRSTLSSSSGTTTLLGISIRDLTVYFKTTPPNVNWLVFITVFRHCSYFRIRTKKCNKSIIRFNCITGRLKSNTRGDMIRIVQYLQQGTIWTTMTHWWSWYLLSVADLPHELTTRE